MTNIKITTFKHGLFWYSCCEIPNEETGETLYYDNTPTIIMRGPTVLHTKGLTHHQSTNKLLDKLEAYYKEKNYKEKKRRKT